MQSQVYSMKSINLLYKIFTSKKLSYKYLFTKDILLQYGGGSSKHFVIVDNNFISPDLFPDGYLANCKRLGISIYTPVTLELVKRRIMEIKVKRLKQMATII